MPPQPKKAKKTSLAKKTCPGCGKAFTSTGYGHHVYSCVHGINHRENQRQHFSNMATYAAVATAAPAAQEQAATINQQRVWIERGKAKAASEAIAQGQKLQKDAYEAQLKSMHADEDMMDDASFGADSNNDDDDSRHDNNNNEDSEHKNDNEKDSNDEDDDADASSAATGDTNDEDGAGEDDDMDGDEDTTMHLTTEDGAPIADLQGDTVEPLFPLWKDFGHDHINYNTRVSPSMSAGIRLMEVIGKHSVDLKLYDDIVGFIRKLADEGYNFDQKIPKRQSLHQQCEQAFNYTSLTPKMIDVPVATLDKPTVTMPVFDAQAVLAKMLQNPELMDEANFAPKYNIFTGQATDDQQDIALAAFDEYPYYDEFHTGRQWPIAVNHYCKGSADAFPCGLVVFYDKSHADRHGTLAVSPVMFTLTLFNKTARASCKFWDVLAYVPNLDTGTNKSAKSSIGIERSPTAKLQDEHICLSNALRQLKDINDNGGIPMKVKGKHVRVKVWIHVMVGDISGNNGLLGSYNTYNVQCPYRDCSCSGDDFLNPKATCTLIKKADIDRMKKDNDLDALKAASKHNIVNAFDMIPTGNPTDSIYHLTPPETMHAICSGVAKRMIDSFEAIMKSSKASKAAGSGFQTIHLLLYESHSAQSEREASAKPSSRNHIFDTTKTQATENMGNLFLIMCALHTSHGKAICNKAGVTDHRRKCMIRTMKMILALERWLNYRTLRTDVDDPKKIQSIIRSNFIPNLVKYFPREQHYDWKLPKVHSLTKFPVYIQMFGSAVNFYGGIGESNLKTFMKRLAHFTQRRAKNFAPQLGLNLYRQSLFDHAAYAIRMQTKSNFQEVKNSAQKSFKGFHTIMFTRVSFGKYDTTAEWPKETSKRPVDDIVIYAITQELTAHDSTCKTVRVTAFNQATLPNNADTLEPYNAGPSLSIYNVDTRLNRFDWCMIKTHKIGSDEEDERLDTWEYTCPAQIHGFIRFDTEGVATPCKRHARRNTAPLELVDPTMYVVVRTSKDFLHWVDIEKQFIAPFQLGELDKCTYILPASRIVNPLYVFEDHGQPGNTPNPSFFAALPKRYTPFYLDHILNEPSPGYGGLSQKREMGAE